MEPVVLEETKFEYREKHYELHFSSFSAFDATNANNIFRNVFIKWIFTYQNCPLRVWGDKFSWYFWWNARWKSEKIGYYEHFLALSVVRFLLEETKFKSFLVCYK